VFSNLITDKPGTEMTRESLLAREDVFVKIIEENEDKFDSLWTNGILLKQFIGEENALKCKVEADTSISIVISRFFVDFKEYSVRMVMPGKVTGTNGFIDSSKILLWPVKSDYFLTQPYEMWAESKVVNLWAWIVTGAFILFVGTGLVIKSKRKR
jgi:hypothetical protein